MRGCFVPTHARQSASALKRHCSECGARKYERCVSIQATSYPRATKRPHRNR